MSQKAHCIDAGLRHQIGRAVAATCAWLLASLLVANGTAAQTGKLAAEKQAKIENAISKFMTEGQTPGVSVAVVQDGELVWSGGFGMADLENSVPATQTRCTASARSQSPSRQPPPWRCGNTAGWIWIPRCRSTARHFRRSRGLSRPGSYWDILAGIRSYSVPEQPYSVSQSDPEVGNTRHFDNGIEGGLKFFANDPLVAQPGTHFNYSTQGYTVAGCAIEGASGRKYADAVRERVLIRAGMLQTRPDERFAIVPLRTRFYSKNESGAVMNAEVLGCQLQGSRRGLLSSATDMARFEAAIHE